MKQSLTEFLLERQTQGIPVFKIMSYGKPKMKKKKNADLYTLVDYLRLSTSIN